MDRNNVCFSQNIVHIFTIPISLCFNNFFFNLILQEVSRLFRR